MDAVFFAVAGVSIIVGIAAILVMLLVKKELRTQVEEVQRKIDFFDEKTNRLNRVLVDRLDRTYSDTMSALQVVDEDLDKLETQLQHHSDEGEETTDPTKTDDSELPTMIEQLQQQSSQEIIKRLDEIEENMAERIALLRTSLINTQQEHGEGASAALTEQLPDEPLYESIKKLFEQAAPRETKTIFGLSREMNVEYARMARVIDLLEQDGLVERVEGKGEYRVSE